MRDRSWLYDALAPNGVDAAGNQPSRGHLIRGSQSISGYSSGRAQAMFRSLKEAATTAPSQDATHPTHQQARGRHEDRALCAS